MSGYSAQAPYRTDEPFAVPLWDGQPHFYRADLHFDGVDHSGDSYEGRVFLDNPDAGPSTAREIDSGYAGSFNVFGHGPCFGDEGHCEVPKGPIHPFDYRRPHPLNRQLMVVTITDGLRHRIDAGAEEIHVTVVPTNDFDEDLGEILVFERLSLVTYD
jgi:hypothetical protein